MKGRSILLVSQKFLISSLNILVAISIHYPSNCLGDKF